MSQHQEWSLIVLTSPVARLSKVAPPAKSKPEYQHKRKVIHHHHHYKTTPPTPHYKNLPPLSQHTSNITPNIMTSISTLLSSFTTDYGWLIALIAIVVLFVALWATNRKKTWKRTLHQYISWVLIYLLVLYVLFDLIILKLWLSAIQKALHYAAGLLADEDLRSKADLLMPGIAILGLAGSAVLYFVWWTVSFVGSKVLTTGGRPRQLDGSKDGGPVTNCSAPATIENEEGQAHISTASLWNGLSLLYKLLGTTVVNTPTGQLNKTEEQQKRERLLELELDLWKERALQLQQLSEGNPRVNMQRLQICDGPDEDRTIETREVKRHTGLGQPIAQVTRKSTQHSEQEVIIRGAASETVNTYMPGMSEDARRHFPPLALTTEGEVGDESVLETETDNIEVDDEEDESVEEKNTEVAVNKTQKKVAKKGILKSANKSRSPQRVQKTVAINNTQQQPINNTAISYSRTSRKSTRERIAESNSL